VGFPDDISPGATPPIGDHKQEGGEQRDLGRLSKKQAIAFS